MNRTLSSIMMMMMMMIICVEHENYTCTYLYLPRYLRPVLLNCRATNLFGNVEISLILFRRDVFDTMSIESKRVSEQESKREERCLGSLCSKEVDFRITFFFFFFFFSFLLARIVYVCDYVPRVYSMEMHSFILREGKMKR